MTFAEIRSYKLKPGDTVVLRAAPGTSYLVNLVVADGTRIELTITGNNPCTVVCGGLGMEININSSERASGLNIEPL